VTQQFELPPQPSLKIDEEWLLQGRVIPPSCTQNNGCILHLQTKKRTWLQEHFHVGRSVIPPEMGVEVLASILMPAQDLLLCDSFDLEEQATELDYLSMAKLTQPEDTICFLTTNGLVFLLQIQGINYMFKKPERCIQCYTIPSQMSLFSSDGNLDELMLVGTNEKNH
jgi:hypothetical protein